MPELIPAAPGSPEWLAARRAGVTATDIVTILGLSSWSSPYSLFWQKMGQVPETPDNDRFRLGRELESYVEQRWYEDHPDAPVVTSHELFANSARPWQMATLDGRFWPDEPGAVVEYKTWADADRHSWQDGPPPAVRAQVLWQMDVMDVPVGHVGVVFLPSGEFRSYVIEHEQMADCAFSGNVTDDGVCMVCHDLDLMQMAGAEFMSRLRLELPAPDPDASAATLAAVKARFTRQPDKQAEIDHITWQAWDDARFAKTCAEDKLRAAEIALREQAGEASVYTVDGQPVARRIVAESQVKAHTRRMDYLKRIVPGDGSEAIAKAIVHEQYRRGERKPVKRIKTEADDV